MRQSVLAGLSLLALAGCNQGSEPKKDNAYPVPDVVPTGEVVAKVGPTVLTTDELEERIRLQNPLVRTRLGDPKELKRFVEAEVRNELLTQVGWEQGLFEDPEVQRALRQAVVRKLMSREVANLDEELEVTEAEIVELYKEREDQYFRPERVRVAQVFLPADSAGAKAKAKARLEKYADQIRARQKQGNRNAFDEVARQITGETGADRRSIDLGFKTREQLEQIVGADVTKTVFETMTVGDVTVAETEDGVALLGKTGRRGEVRRSLESVKPSLVAQIRADKRSQSLEKRIDEMAEERGIDLTIQNLDKMAFGKVPVESEDAPEK